MPPIFRTVKNVMGTLSEEIVKKEPVSTRTQFDELRKIPDEVKRLEPEAKLEAEAEILDVPMTEEFIGVRQEDISRETQKTYGELHRTQDKIDSAIDEDKYAILLEKQRDLYTKADDLLKERELVKQMEAAKTEGIDTTDSIYNIISDQIGVGRVATNKEARSAAIYNRLNSTIFELKDKLRTKNFGLSQNKELAHEVLRYLKNGTVKNENILSEVKLISKQWTDAADKARNLRNKAGGRVAKLDDWIIPQSHDKRKVRKAGFKDWRNNIIGKLDRARIESETGQPLEDVLTSAYKNITNPKVEVTPTKGGVSIGKQGQERRVLHYKDADSQIEYEEVFGNPDIFGTMDNFLRQQSDEIALMQIFGSNPQNTYNKLKEIARTEGMGTAQEMKLDAQWRVSSGLADGDSVVDDADALIANIGGGYRSIQVASKLGTALISSLADLGNIFIGAGYRNLSSIKIAGRGLQGLLQEAVTPGTVGKNIEIANRIGVVSEFANASLANSRFAESTGAGFAQKSAEAIIRASGLGAYTQALRASFGLELAANIAENFSKNLDDVPFASMLKEYGIDDAAWNVIKSTQTKDIKNSKFLDINKVYEVDEELGYRVSEMITNEMNAFVIMPGDRVRKYTTAGMAKGTVGGEAARMMTLFKSFPIAITMMHINRIGQIKGFSGKSGYVAKTLLAGTVMGGITNWAYDIASGKTPRSVDRPAAVLEAITKSGALGIWGDFFLGATENRYGHSWTSTLIGVPASTLEDIAKSAQDLMYKDADDAVGSIYKRAKSYIPGQNMWYTRAVIERTLGDFIGEAVDPNHKKKLRKQKKAMRMRNQEFLLK